jgi:hypothetical protein
MFLTLFYCDEVFGCYKSHPLKENLVPRFREIGKGEKGAKIQILTLIILLMHLWSSLHKSISVISKIQIMHVYNQQAFTSHIFARTALSKRN